MATFAYGDARETSDDSSDTSMLGSGPLTPPIQIVEEENIVEGETNDDDQPQTPPKMDARAYQLEMFDLSLKENIIVAMDTGSGKTQVALLRMRAELDSCDPDKLLWFLAPTVMLCAQQHDVIHLQMPSVPLKLLTGNENVDSWSESTWDTILKDTQIIVSTPAVLHDALCHAYVRMEMLALLIFDEAHNCVKKAPGRKIMIDFYHVRNSTARSVPAILGLSATPSIRAETQGLEYIEKTLDARCVTPTLHREELLKYSNRPVVRAVLYSLSQIVSTPAMKSLCQVWHGLDIRDDPYVVSLQRELTEQNRERLFKAVTENKTYCQEQLSGLFNRSLQIARELGIWASDRYLRRVRDEYLGKLHKSHEFFDQWTTEEKLYLGRALQQVHILESSEIPSDLSAKAILLFQELLAAAENHTEPPVCVIFARERATVSMLYELLSASPRLSEQFRMGAVVGISKHARRKNDIYDLLSNVNDISVLQKFRSGTINLLIATSVLEEGIDVPACNLVICFDELQTFKSFIQRRGRARMRASSLIVFLERGGRMTQQWEAMEEEMKQQYQDEDRERQQIIAIEEGGDEAAANLVFRVDSTGARIGLDEAKGHLSHFCSKLSRGEFLDPRPVYLTKKHKSDAGKTLVTCEVVLGTFLPVDVQTTMSSRAWETESNAMKDAALQAYVKLYHAGLVNDNLLPFKPSEIPGVEVREAIATVDHSFKPWTQVARDWQAGTQRWAYTFTCVDEDGNEVGQYEMFLPAELPQPREIKIYRDFGVTWKLRVSTGRQLASDEAISDHTSALLASVFGHRWAVLDEPHIVQVSVQGSESISRSQIGARAFNIETDMNRHFAVRDATNTGFTFRELLPSKPPSSLVRHIFEDYDLAPSDEPYVVLKKWTKRSDFLHSLAADPSTTGPVSTKPYDWLLPVSLAKVDNIPACHVQFGMLIPSVIHELEVMLTVKHLTENLLKPVGFSDSQLVREAISSRAANEPYQYERLENLGDSILKYCAAIHAVSTNPGWPEGYLSLFKDRLVSNSRLSRAATEKGIAKYILTKPFTGAKWRPLYVNDILKDDEANTKKADRKLSTKTLADVVEALIGAAYHNGGIERATKCLGVFLDDQDWHTPAESRQFLYELQPITPLPTSLEPLESLIGYTFNKKAILVEAVTHGSFTSGVGNRSYERLEFLGDAVLDKIIITRLFAFEPRLTHDKMHTLKTSVVNADFLAFICFEYGLRKEETTVTNGEPDTQEVTLPLWKFLRHNSVYIGAACERIEEKYHQLRPEILAAMNEGTHYPWALFARLRAHKFFSDVFEALLGAVWLDSGSLGTCEAIVARFGILGYLDRLLRDGVECQHPKEVIGKCAVEKKVKYEVGNIDIGQGEREFTCSVYVGDRLITKVDSGVGNEEVKTKAATEAVRIMTAEVSKMGIE